MRIKKEKTQQQGCIRRILAGLCLAGQLGLAAGLCPEIGQIQRSGIIQEKGVMYTAASGGAAASYEAAALSKEQNDPKLSLHAQSAVLMDGLAGRILYGKNENDIRPMASTTKIMTCILALEAGGLDEFAEASSNAAAQPQVRLGVKKGERYQIRDLLYALMLESYNDAAVMIAEKTAGSTEEFSRRMNEKAESLGCRDTWFITPNGLDKKEEDENGTERIHSTTAADLAQILRYCITQSPQKEEFLKITRTSDYYFTDESGKRAFSCRNHNALLTMMDGALTGKTGFTGGAGYCYTGALFRDGRLYIISLLGCGWPPHKTYKWADARRLFSYGLEQYELTDIFKPEPEHTICTEGGICWGENPEGVLHAVMKQEETDSRLEILLNKEEKEGIRREVMLPERIFAPVKKGELLGNIQYSLGDRKLGEYGLYADRDIEALTVPAAWKHICGMFFIF